MSLSQAQFADVAAKLGMPTEMPLTKDGLTSIYRAWCRNVGYDNISLLKYLDSGSRGDVPGMPGPMYFRLWLDQGVANFCWANCEALGALLSTYGFRTSRVIGTMGTGRNLLITAMPHGSLAAYVGEEKYIVDATFLCEEPLAIVPGEQTTAGAGSLQVWSDPDGQIRWQLPQSRFSGSFRIEDEDVRYERFEEEHRRTVDGLANGRLYRDKLYLRRNTGDGTVTYDHGHIIRRTADSFTIERVPKGAARDALKTFFGLGDAAVNDIPDAALH
ncbi:arylamine N-acetyltransferase [Salinarimonas sp.]|uniref:arylamine N-acetyltransferase n=1 Tax=Salinarimonas sp. TaxID=2766526 RepID=UPI0032D96DB1